MKSLFKEWLKTIKSMLITAGVVLFITKVFVMIAYIPSSSMEPTLPTGSLTLCSRIDYWTGQAKRGDVIVFFRDDETDKKAYTKRIVGLPGEEIEIRRGTVLIDGKVYLEPRLKESAREEDFGPVKVPDGCVFAMGDNRNNSYDCRYWPEHFIQIEDVRARVCVVFSSEKGLHVVERVNGGGQLID